MPVILNGRETWPATQREEHRLKVSENRALKTMFGVLRDAMTGGWTKLHNYKRHKLHSSTDTVRIMRWAGHVARKGKVRSAHKILTGMSENKRLLRRRKRRCEENIKMHRREQGLAGLVVSVQCPP